MSPVLTVFKMFGKSPIKLINSHMRKVFECVEAFMLFFDEVLCCNWDSALSLRKEVVKLEREADALKIEIRAQVPKSLFSPIPRMQILDMLDTQDEVANLARDITGIVIGRHLNIPDNIKAVFIDFLASVQKIVLKAKNLVSELELLLVVGFRGEEARHVRKTIKEIDQQETNADDLALQTAKNLFAIERELYSVDVVFLYQTIRSISKISDLALIISNYVGNCIED